ncbi:MAG: type II toxin-antitoxin system HicA family toxin [Candidatus Cloacimonetes bacterium]|nr:type II toxin-antitoxin system HicA family toxin [Candidatus Cloacimonadota bacterium]MBL7085924.1 type II toxin-antitoxin system HicA family toxin [Candidatus Cloacimonadota bacterium]
MHKLGFDGPLAGTKHHFMVYKECRLAIPSNSEYSIPQLRMMLRETESILGRKITVEEWNNL